MFVCKSSDENLEVLRYSVLASNTADSAVSCRAVLRTLAPGALLFAVL